MIDGSVDDALRALHIVLATTFFASCGKAASEIQPSPPRIPNDIGGLTPEPGIAEWRYTPAPPEAIQAKLVLKDGSCLAIANATRFLIEASHNTAGRPCHGLATASPFIADEDLENVIPTPHGFRFIGKRGTLFESDTPLGPFSKKQPPGVEFASVASFGEASYAVRLDGRLFRLQGSDWAEVGRINGHPISLELSNEGDLLALSLPEAIWASSDGGISFVEAGTRVGAQHLARSTAGSVFAQGARGSLTWDRKHGRFVSAQKPPAREVLQFSIEIPDAPNANAVEFGRAVFSEDDYHEARQLQDKTWVLLEGRFGGPLRKTALPEAKKCQSVRLGSFKSRMLFACIFEESDEEIAAELFQRNTIKDEFKSIGRFGAPDTDAIRIAVSPDAALVTGICKVHGDKACHPKGPLRIDISGESSLVMAPAVESAARLVTFSEDGASAYFLAERTKDRALSVFVSKDSGRNFHSEPLIFNAHTEGQEQEEDELEGEEEEAAMGLRVSETSDSSLTVSQGTVGIRLTAADGTHVYLTVDENGQRPALAMPPGGATLLSGYGRRVLAVEPPRNDGQAIRLYESLDGGKAWTRISAPLASEKELESSACGLFGCVFGETFSRVGWRDTEPFSEPQTPPRQPTSLLAKLGSPIVCQMLPRKNRTLLENVYERLPNASSSVRGDVIWSLVSSDQKTHETRAYFAKKASPDVVERRILLPPTKAATNYSEIVFQLEGYAAARVNTEAKNPSRAALHVGWANFFEGSVSRGSIPMNSGDAPPSSPDKSFGLSLLSVSSGGIFVQPARSDTAYFLSVRGKNQPVRPPWAHSTCAGLPECGIDAVWVDSHPLWIGFYPSGGTPNLVFTGQTTADAPLESAVTLALGEAGTKEVYSRSSIGYSGPSPGVVSTYFAPRSDAAWATFLPFDSRGALGRALPVPLLDALPKEPRPCSAEEQLASPRIEATSVLFNRLFGTLHTVTVKDPTPLVTSASRPFVSATTIIQGSAASPCVSAIHAVPLDDAPESVIVMGDLSRAFLFRAETSRPSKTRRADTLFELASLLSRKPPRLEPSTVEVLPMSCRYEAFRSPPEGALRELEVLK